jgi:hypothetical protein
LQVDDVAQWALTSYRRRPRPILPGACRFCMRESPEMDAIERYCAASQANDIDGIMLTLSDDAELVSPLSGRMVFRGEHDVRLLLSAVYSSLKGWRWTEVIGDGDTRVVMGEGPIGPFKLGDAMLCEMAPDGRIKRVRPHLRPWLATTLFALLLGPKVARHPGVVLRALRG